MAPAASTMAAGAALGAAAVWSSGAFVPQAGPQTTRPSRGASSQLRAGASAGGATQSQKAPQLAGAAFAALGLAALAVGRKAEGSRSQHAATVVRAEASAEATEFAGGLIGNRSATGGEWNFDPLNISTRCEKFLPWFREAELKHGRVAMLGFLGLIVPDIVRVPGPEACYNAPVTEALSKCSGEVTNLGFPLFFGPNLQVYLFVGLIEMMTTFPKITQGLITLERAGDYQLGLNFLPKEEAAAKDMKLKELQNGRLAMMAFMGGLTQAQISGNGFPWLFSEPLGSRGPGLASAAKPAGQRLTAPRVAMRAEDGYKMSKAVPFLPVSPALEGYPGEEDGFDPMGFSLALDIRWLREAELKHGRVAMLATAGWIATDLGMRVPGTPFEVSTIAAHDAMVKFGAMPQMLVWFGYAELYGFLAINTMMEGKTDRKPGDFGLRALYPKDEQGQYDMQLKELRNGRLAMLAFGGIATSAVLTGKTWPFFATGAERPCGAAPSMGEGSVLCGGLKQAQARGAAVAARVSSSKSLPFLPKPENLAGWVGEEQEFDPLGFSDTFDMKWLREAELKHGRVCMAATVGFFSQQYITFPGMNPTPDALQAVYTAPAPAVAALLFLAGWIESSSYGGKITMLDMFEDERTPGDFNFGAGFLKGKSDKEVYDMKLRELNNGRLAMLAFSGMVHHNIVVKGPLFPLFPEGWAGPQGSWELDSVMGRFVDGRAGLGA